MQEITDADIQEIQLVVPNEQPEPKYVPVQVYPPDLTIVEEPAEFYRFRYPSEIANGKLGGMLLGRSSTSSNKSFIKVRISGIDPRQHSKLQLIVCTASPDKAPHPYYLHGDLCQDGYYKWEKTVDERTQSTLDVTFDRLAVICVSKAADAIKAAMEERQRHVPVLMNCPTEPMHKYEGRNLGKIRLAFVLSFDDASGQLLTLMPIFSDEISDNKQNKSLVLDELIPNEVPTSGGTEVAIYVKLPTTGITKSETTVQFDISDSNARDNRTSLIVCEVKEIKKHLLVVVAPDIRGFTTNERIKVPVTVNVAGSVSSELSIVFNNALNASASRHAALGQKRKR